MSIAWTTVIVIVLLLPGLGFMLGYAAQERYSRELIRSNAIGDVGMAVFCAIVSHLAALLFIVNALHFDPSVYYRPLLDYDRTERWLLEEQMYARLWPTAGYILGVTVVAFFCGRSVAWGVMFGPRWLRSFATHKWAYDLLKEVKGGGVVTTTVLTEMSEGQRILMYLGHLEEFYLEANGTFAYIVLKNCYRFYMELGEDVPVPSLLQQPLSIAGTRRWEHFTIAGDKIANVLFDPVGFVNQTAAGTAALNAALAGQTLPPTVDDEG
jgi:hypothetical protein